MQHLHPPAPHGAYFLLGPLAVAAQWQVHHGLVLVVVLLKKTSIADYVDCIARSKDRFAVGNQSICMPQNAFAYVVRSLPPFLKTVSLGFTPNAVQIWFETLCGTMCNVPMCTM